MGLGPLRRRGATALIGTLLALPIHASPVTAGEPAPPGECPAFKPLSEVSEGATGNGWTVERGTQRERFRFEVLGIIDDGIAPGRDLIVVEISDTAGNDMIDRAGGGWAGISGSPVYLGNKLLGATAYSFTAGPSAILGVTPAVDMADVLAYGASSSQALPKTVKVPAAMRAALAERAGVSTAEANSFHRLPIPVAVSGLNARARGEFQEALADRGLSAIVFPASRAARAAGAAISDRPEPGGNFAGLISYGDVTVGGVGTTTYVCGNRALAFGHPLAFAGATAFGANNAHAITVVNDPTLFPFKLANVTDLFGKLDQDRLTAIRANLNKAPKLRAITSQVTNADTGADRNGRTDVTANNWVPDIAAFHLLSNADVVFDQIGPGTSMVEWTVNGKRRNGNPWQLTYSNRYASQFDITFDSIFQLFEQLAIIHGNPFEAVRFTSVDIDATFDDTYTSYAIERVRISKNGGAFRERSFIAVQPGDDLRARVSLRRYRADVVNVDVQVTVPNDAEPGSFGSLVIAGGSEFFFGEPPSVDTFAQLLNALENTPKNNHLLADLVLSRFDGESASDSDRESLDAVVGGFVEIGVEVQ